MKNILILSVLLLAGCITHKHRQNGEALPWASRPDWLPWATNVPSFAAASLKAIDNLEECKGRGSMVIGILKHRQFSKAYAASPAVMSSLWLTLCRLEFERADELATKSASKTNRVFQNKVFRKMGRDPYRVMPPPPPAYP